MKAVLFEKIGSVKLGEASKPVLETEKDAIVKVTHTAICGTDLHILNGNIPVEESTILGHEAVGVVEKTGSDVKRVKIGDRIVLSCTVQCGQCTNCQKGLVALCKHGGIFGCGKQRGGFPGAQAEYIRVPFADMVLEPIPSDLTEEQAIFVGDILSTGYMASENGSIEPGDVVVIFGAGPVGLCTIATARLFGPSLIVGVDVLDYRLEAAKHLGADIVINSSNTDILEEIKRITDGRGADVAIEAVGSAETLNHCIESVRGGGNISIVGVFPPGMVEMSMKKMVIRNIQIRMGLVNMVNMGRLMSLIKHCKLDLFPLITHRMSLGEVKDAYRIFRSKSENVLKVILHP
jgi:threonine dehydrogenase-like Zn-dependent dehydrogenase